jgi:simple sugar transport system permease protein
MLRLEPRPGASRLWTYASPLLAIALTVGLGVLIFLALDKDPVRALQMFFWEPLKSKYAIGELMVKATPLLLIALGLSLCFRSNVWNIGAEGQFVIGAVCADTLAAIIRLNSTTGTTRTRMALSGKVMATNLRSLAPFFPSRYVPMVGRERPFTAKP